MNWRKSFLLSFIPLLAFMVFLLTDKKQEARTAAPQKRVVASVDKKKKKQPEFKKTETKKDPVAYLQRRTNQNESLKNRIPQSVQSSFTRDKSVRVTKGYEFLTDVAAIPKKDYHPDMGEKLQEHNGFVFFRAPEGHSYHPVAISRMNHNLYPISSVLHIKGATPEIRTSLLAQGHKEYYYHAPLKFLSIKAETDQLLHIYSQLKEQGFKVELEVLKPKHQTI